MESYTQYILKNKVLLENLLNRLFLNYFSFDFFIEISHFY